MFSFLFGSNMLEDNLIIVAILLSIVTSLFQLLFRVFITLAVGEDAKAIGVKERTLFMVLSFVFPIICPIVYIACRKNVKKIQPKICNICGLSVSNDVQICPQCANTQFTDYLIVDNAVHKSKSKQFRNLAIGCLILAFLLNSFANAYALKEFLLGQDKNISGYSDSNNIDDLNDFFNQFDFE